jgi:hypothetical protein
VKQFLIERAKFSNIQKGPFKAKFQILKTRVKAGKEMLKICFL